MTYKPATIVGCAIGDALGNFCEMKSPSSPMIKNWDGLFKAGGTFWKGEAGMYTDDTLATIALSKSLIQCNGFNPEDVANEYLYWYNTGNTRGIGATTAQAIAMLKIGAKWDESGLTSSQSAGNGTAMRASPLGIVYRHNLMKLIECATLDASITHNNLEPKLGSVAMALGTALLINRSHDNQSVLEAVKDIITDSIVKVKLSLAKKHLENETSHEQALAEIGTSGYVPETVGAAFYCLAKTNNFKDAVIMAVKAGFDTDTTASCVGALAGSYYGIDAIPDYYKNNVENFELLNGLTEELMDIDI